MNLITGNCIPNAWEQALKKVYNDGVEYTDTLDLPITIVVDKPLQQPILHKCIPCGIGQLVEYEYEVLFGIKNHLIGTSDTAWEYSYNQRFNTDNQLDTIIKKLSNLPHTRQAVINIGDSGDRDLKDPPCLQCIVFRVENNKLNMTTFWRSRDLFKAWMMNVWAITRLQEIVSKRLNLNVGRYTDISTSCHIYKSYLEEVEGRLEHWEITSFVDRVYNTEDPIIVALMNEAKQKLADNEPIYF